MLADSEMPASPLPYVTNNEQFSRMGIMQPNPRALLGVFNSDSKRSRMFLLCTVAWVSAKTSIDNRSLTIDLKVSPVKTFPYSIIDSYIKGKY